MAADEGANKVYDRYARRFDEEDPRASGYRSAAWFRAERDLILGTVARCADAGGPLLDLACGAGLVSRPLRAEGWEVIGLDFNHVACMKALSSGMPIVRGDAFRMPFAGATFRTIMNVEFLQQYDRTHVARMLAECARVLLPGGRVVLVWRNGRSFPHRLAGGSFRLVDRLRGSGRLQLVDHPVHDVLTLGADVGLRADVVEAISPPLGRSIRLTSRVRTMLVGTSYLAVLVKDQEEATDFSAGD